MNFKKSIALPIILAVILTFVMVIPGMVSGYASPSTPAQLATPVGPVTRPSADPLREDAVHGFYFYANDCPHCLAVLEEVIDPAEARYGDLLDLRLLEIGLPEYYEAMLTVEDFFDVPGEDRSIPTLVIDNRILIGEQAIRAEFMEIVEQGLAAGGVAFPNIAGIDPQKLVSVSPDPTDDSDEICDLDEGCSVDAPIFIAYFYQTGCDVCSRVTADLDYLRNKYPQMQVQTFNIYENADLAAWLTEQVGYQGEFYTPALFIGDQVLVDREIQLEKITAVLERVKESGTEPLWLNYDPAQGQSSVIDRFKSMGWMAVVFAGLIDGINPCAFATLIFFVSYLTLSGRKGKEVLLVGGSFAAGVFLAYLAVGLGVYKFLERFGSALDIVSRIVYLLTGIFCLVLAVFSFIDYRRAKGGKTEDMMLKLPEPLRKQINATIRKGRNTRHYVFGAFLSGILISFLELACTGQVYLPTIIFVSSIPELRLRAFLFLVIYNLLFILPLVVIFILVYFGTTSKQLTQFFQERAALVKFAMGVLFVALGGWLIFSLVS